MFVEEMRELRRQNKKLQEELELQKRANKILNDLVGELQIELDQMKRQRDAALAGNRLELVK